MTSFALCLLAFLALLFISCAGTIHPKSLSKSSSLRQFEFSSFGGLSKRKRDRRGRRRQRGSKKNHNARRCRNLRFRTLDGSCNNLRNIHQGSADTPFHLVARTVKHDIKKLPNARVVSNIVCAEASLTRNSRRLSEIATFFGQFIDHTIVETSTQKKRPWHITVPRNDPVFKAGDKLDFLRTKLTGRGKHRAPENLLSSYLDLATVYSVEKKIEQQIREGKDGLLKVSKGNLMPTNEKGFFRAGERRSNENPLLTAMHTLWVREHNRVAKEVKAAFPNAKDEQMFQITRKVVIALFQSVVYDEFLPAIVGRGLGRYRGYKKNVRAVVTNSFSTVAFRVGHTMLNPVITSIQFNGRKRQTSLRHAFFKPSVFRSHGMDNLFRGMLRTRAAEVDNKVTDEVRSFLIATQRQPRSIRLDLTALNIQRARDHGVPNYNALRAAFGLKRRKNINQITGNSEVRRRLRRAYEDDVNKIDPWVGGISEKRTMGSLGELFGTIWLDQFRRLRDGDRFFFEARNLFSVREIRKIPTLRALVGTKTLRGKVMQNILEKNTDISYVPANPFFTN